MDKTRRANTWKARQEGFVCCYAGCWAPVSQPNALRHDKNVWKTCPLRNYCPSSIIDVTRRLAQGVPRCAKWYACSLERGMISSLAGDRYVCYECHWETFWGKNVAKGTCYAISIIIIFTHIIYIYIYNKIILRAGRKRPLDLFRTKEASRKKGDSHRCHCLLWFMFLIILHSCCSCFSCCYHGRCCCWRWWWPWQWQRQCWLQQRSRGR